LTIGLIGGYTTLSTFSYKSFRLLDDSKLTLMVINLMATVLFSMFAVYLRKIVALNFGTYMLRELDEKGISGYIIVNIHWRI